MQYRVSGIQEMLLGQLTITGHYEGTIILILGQYFVKHHVLIHFDLRYHKGIAHD